MGAAVAAGPNGRDGAGPPPLVALEQVTRRFGPVPALQRVDLRLEAGTHLLLAGPNGAGKTTLLRLIAGLARPQGGRVRLAGLDPVRDPAIRSQVGLLSHQPLSYADLTCAENLRFFARLYGLERVSQRVPEVLARVGLWDRRDQRVGSLSRGMTQRLALARATLHEPRLLLLDEPFSGLDAGAVADLGRYLQARAARNGTASVLVTHRVAEVAGLVNRVLLLERGRVRGDWPWSGRDGAALEAACGAGAAGGERTP